MSRRSAIAVMALLAGTAVQAGVMFWQVRPSAAGFSGGAPAVVARVRFAGGRVDARLGVWDGDDWRMLNPGECCADVQVDSAEFAAGSPERMFVRELVDDTLSSAVAPVVAVDLDNASQSLRTDGGNVAVSSFDSIAPTPFVFWNAGNDYGYR